MEFYNLIDMTSVGYSNMVKNDSMKLSTLKKIAEVLKSSIGEILDEEIGDESQIDSQLKSMTDEDITSEILNDSMTNDEKIIILKDRIESLTSQLKMTTHIAEIRKRRIAELEQKMSTN